MLVGLFVVVLWILAPALGGDAPQGKGAAERGDEPRVKEHDSQRGAFDRASPEADTVPIKVSRYARRLVARYDRNGDGVLQPEEWKEIGPSPALDDVKADQVLSVDELARRIADFGQRRRIRLAYPIIGLTEDKADEGAAARAGSTPTKPATARSAAENGSPPDSAEIDQTRRTAKFYVPAKRLPAGLPAWFLARDEDGDGQLTLREFAPKATPADIEEFRQYDLNGDGLITARECVRALKSMKGSAKKASR